MSSSDKLDRIEFVEHLLLQLDVDKSMYLAVAAMSNEIHSLRRRVALLEKRPLGSVKKKRTK